MMPVKRPLWLRLLLIADYLLNIIYSLVPALRRKGFGYAGETVSSVIGKRFYIHGDRHWFIVAHYKIIERLDPGHFKASIDCGDGDDIDASRKLHETEKGDHSC